MKNTAVIFTTLLFITILFSCKNEPTVKYKELNLLSHGFPITIIAPDSAKVEKTLGSIIKELTITGNDNFGLLVQSSPALEYDPKKIKAEKLTDIKNSRIFSKVLKEDETGFLYETSVDSTDINYEFFYVKVMGDVEYTFSTPYTGSFSQEQATKIYESLNKVK